MSIISIILLFTKNIVGFSKNKCLSNNTWIGEAQICCRMKVL